MKNYEEVVKICDEMLHVWVEIDNKKQWIKKYKWFYNKIRVIREMLVEIPEDNSAQKIEELEKQVDDLNRVLLHENPSMNTFEMERILRELEEE